MGKHHYWISLNILITSVIRIKTDKYKWSHKFQLTLENRLDNFKGLFFPPFPISEITKGRASPNHGCTHIYGGEPDDDW